MRDATAHHILIDDRDGRYAFRHALLQEAAYAELLPGERVTLHRAYADALAAHPQWAASRAGAAAELAHHYAAAHDVARAVEFSVKAAGAAVDAHAVGEAHALFEQALALWEQAPEPAALAGCDRIQLLQRCADAAMLAGAIGRAVELVGLGLQEVDGARDPQRVALLRWRLARLLWISGDAEGSVATHAAAVSTMPAEASAERAMILAADAHVLMLSGQYRRSRGRCEEAIDVAQAAGALREEGHALNTLGGSFCRLGDPGQGAGTWSERWRSPRTSVAWRTSGAPTPTCQLR